MVNKEGTILHKSNQHTRKDESMTILSTQR